MSAHVFCPFLDWVFWVFWGYETEFRNLNVRLEDEKITYYETEDRSDLRNIHSTDWPKFLKKANDWLFGLDVRLEYGDNAEEYKELVPDNTKDAGVMALSNLLQIQHHDYRVMLKAILILVRKLLTKEAVAKANQIKEELQTKIHEAIAAVQAIIVDPKTDRRPGEAGR
ncbi:unnamed protein product [Nyctereutes procyonoides]|uniref:RNA transcription, translation and transport factor protein n=1 Tax=Nyctereutes procyonoides TaxID=34880 RepID=A0A811Y5F1_NYCPR|nr:unnamed protein product [Nyctereutes procyonoides]